MQELNEFWIDSATFIRRNIGTVKILKSHHPHLLPAIVMLFLLNSTAVYGQNEITAEQVQKIRTAAERGDAQAQCDLARYYGKGTGVVQDGAEAVKWWIRAAEQGHAESQHILGVLHAAGRVVEKNQTKAVMWFRRSAEQGYSEAQFSLGNSYSEGVGVVMNDDESIKWFRKAAEQGHAKAQHIIGLHYIHTNKVEAYKWHLLSKVGGHEDGKGINLLDIITRGLTPEDRAEGQRLAAEWQAKFEKNNPDK